MKVFIIVATTLDGFIAQEKSQNSLAWTSEADKKHFVALTKRAGVIVMGATTFGTIGKALKDRRTIVYSPDPIPGIETTTLPPAELIKKLESEGHTELAICGGASIYTMFAKAGVVDTIYITKEPVTFGKGISLFTEPVQLKMQLANEEKVGDTLLLEYAIQK